MRQQEAHLSLLSRVKVCLEEAKFLTCNQPAVVEISLSIHCLSIVAATYYDHDGDDDDDDDYVLRENMCHMPPHRRRRRVRGELAPKANCTLLLGGQGKARSQSIVI